jgi:hypothetical protein
VLAKQNPEDALIERMASFRHNPESCALFSFPWGQGELKGKDGPREWQRDVLRDIGEHLRNPETRYQPLQIAAASGHGIGKSALIGMIVHWGMSTCADTRVVITANTDTQLRTKTAPEVGKWFRLAINKHWFNVTATAIASVDTEHEKSWRSDFIPWSENNTEAFAGLHNEGKRIIVIMDEGSAISDKIYEVVEGALTDENTEILWIVFGNPTRNSGRFRECFRRWKHRWRTRQIDSRTVEGTNKAQIDKWVQDYGEDSDFVKIRVRGIFPSMSAKQFISETDVDAAFGKHLRPEQYSFAPKIIGVDPAWSGDDSFEIWLRQGLASRLLGSYPKNDNDVEMANIIARFEDAEKADAVFVDAGYGTGIVSAGTTMGRDWQLVWFGGKSADAGCLNKRAEMWKSLRDWLKAGGVIPPDNELRDELTSIETVPRFDGIIQLESKEQLKDRQLPSPNKADALALTFAFPVALKPRSGYANAQTRVITDYDPFKF